MRPVVRAVAVVVDTSHTHTKEICLLVHRVTLTQISVGNFDKRRQKVVKEESVTISEKRESKSLVAALGHSNY